MREISMPGTLSNADSFAPPRLVVERPGMSRVTYDVELGETSVGRRQDCGIVLPSPDVEPEHFRIRRGETYCALEDASRESVTMINGIRITERQVLRHNDRIQAGSVVMEFHDNQENVDTEVVPVVVDRNAKVRIKGNVVTAVALKHGLVFGRGGDADVELEDPAVSRKHCQIIKDGPVFRIKDLGSLLGVFLNGRKTMDAELLPGDRLQIGQFHFRNEGKKLQRVEDSGGGVISVFESDISGAGVTIPARELVAVYGNTARQFLDAIDGEPVNFRAGINGVSGGVDARRVGECGQNHDELTVREAITLQARLTMPGADCKRLVAGMLAKLELDGRESIRLSQLTSAEYKRACIAAEWVRRPQVLLLDFPFSNLDPLETGRLLMMLREIADAGCTVVYSTQLNEQFSRVNRLVVVRDGMIVTAAEPGETAGLFAVPTLGEIPAALAAGVMPELRAGMERSSALTMQEPPKNKESTRIGVLLGREWRLLRRWNLLWLVAPPLILAALASLVAVDGALLLFVAYAGALWFGLMSGGMAIVGDLKVYRREPEVSLGSFLISKCLFSFGVAITQSLFLYLVLIIWGMGLPGSTFWQLLSLVLSAAAGTAIGLALSAMVPSRLAVAGIAPLIMAFLIFLSGYPVPAHAMRPVSSMIGSVMPSYAAQRLMDVSVLWDRRVNADMRKQHPAAVLNVYEKQSDEAVFRQWRPCLAGIIVLVLWTVGGVAATAYILARKESVRIKG